MVFRDGLTDTSPVFQTFSSDGIPQHFLAPGNEMLVTFVTDGTLSRPSFSADFEGSKSFDSGG